MFTPKTTLDLAAMQRQLDLLDKSPAILSEVVLDVASENEAAILDDLSFVPGPVSRPVEWETPRQMRAFFATDGFGGGIPHRRKAQKPMGWEVQLETRGAITTIGIQNIWNAARYVFGNLIGAPKGDQQKMHHNTGWQLAAPKVTRWFDELNDTIYKRYRERVKEERRKR